MDGTAPVAFGQPRAGAHRRAHPIPVLDGRYVRRSPSREGKRSTKGDIECLKYRQEAVEANARGVSSFKCGELAPGDVRPPRKLILREPLSHACVVNKDTCLVRGEDGLE